MNHCSGEKRICRQFFSAILFIFIILLFSAVSEAALPAKIVSFRPDAYTVIQDRRNNAAIGQEVATGNVLVTSHLGNMSLLLPDYMILKIAEDTEFQYLGPEKIGNNGILRKGKVWLRGRSRDAQFGISTPTATATIRGTEWYMDVAQDGTTTIGIIDGSVHIANEFGSILLNDRESAVVKPGTAPVKTVMIAPENAVNWTLRYRPPWDKEDMRRDGEATTSMIEKTLAAYYANDLARAFTYLNKEKASFGTTPSWSALAGFLYLVSGKDQIARQYFSAAANAAPDWALPYALLATAAIVENNIAEARVMADKALLVQQNSALAMLANALTFKAELKLDQAYAWILKAVEQSPGFTAARLTAATIALETDDINSCRRLLQGMPQDGPLAAERLTLLGFVSLREGYPVKALESFRQAIALDPDEAEAVMGEGIALFNLNRPQQAMETMAKAALLSPRSSSFQSYLAKAFFELKQWDDAQKCLDRARRLDPKDPTPYLYEALMKYALHRPGEALQAMEKAAALNSNRAVFRSRFLLDQDSGVLTSNTARIYNELAFPRASVLTAARALEMNPADEGAHRRLYFALNNDPQAYQQASESAKTLMRHLTSPSRTGVVFDESKANPYQEMFDRAGVDPALFGQYLYDKNSSGQDTSSRTINENYSAIMAAKTTVPLAFYVQGLLGKMDTNLGSNTNQSYPYYSMSSVANTIIKQDINYYNNFIKWRPTWDLDFFSDVVFSQTDTKTNYDGTSIMTFPGYGDFVTASSTLSRMQGSTSDVKLGGRFKLSPHTQVLFNYLQINSFSKLSSDSATSGVINSNSNGELDNLRRIVQAALWETVGNHNFQFGVRYSEGQDKMDNKFYYIPLDSLTASNVNFKDYTYSAYLHHQFLIRDDLRVAWGLFAHNPHYSMEDGRTYSTSVVHPALGVSWDLNSNWRMRTAYIESLIGDRKERLQPVMMASFPLIASSNISDLYTPEEQIALTRKSLAAGLDYHSPRTPFFCGIEMSLDRDETSKFTGSTNFREDKRNSARRVSAYLETLITNQLSANLNYRYSELDLPSKANEHSIGAGLAYFFISGLAVKIQGSYVDRHANTGDATNGKEGIWLLEPEIFWYLLDNTMKLELKGHYQDRGLETINSDVINRTDDRWIRLAATIYF